MKDAWQNKKFAWLWDSQTAIKGNPFRRQQLAILTSIIKDVYQPGKTIIDLGFGSGRVEEMLFRMVPKAKIIGIDYSKAMMAIADKRLAKYNKRFRSIECPLEKLDSLKLPATGYQIIFSVQAFHHLTYPHQKKLYFWVYKNLAKGGIFLINDRVAINTKALGPLYKSIWDQTNRKITFKQESFAEYKKKIGGKEDSPAYLKQHLNWLSQSGFKSACLHLHFDRALIAGIK